MSRRRRHDNAPAHLSDGAAGRRSRWWHVRRRSDAADHIYESPPGYARYWGSRVYVSGHKDAKLSPSGLRVWHFVLAAIIVGGIVMIVLAARLK